MPDQAEALAAQVQATDRPLVVDLDGSLILSDALICALWQMCREAPWQVFPSAAGLLQGRVALKQQFAQRIDLDVAALPYNHDVIRLVEDARRNKRSLVLATGSHQLVADKIAIHLGFFDLVLGSSGSLNFKGKAKAVELVRRYGVGGYDYIGDSRADIPVWRSAHTSYVVDPGGRLSRLIRSADLEVQPLGAAPL